MNRCARSIRYRRYSWRTGSRNQRETRKKHSLTKKLIPCEYRKVKEVMSDIEQLHEQVIIKQNVKEMHFDIPKELTREVYVQVIRKVLACVRHECYNEVQKILKRDKKNNLSNEEFDQVINDINEQHQETYR